MEYTSQQKQTPISPSNGKMMQNVYPKEGLLLMTNARRRVKI